MYLKRKTRHYQIFGSRVDLYFEKNLLVKKGQNVLSGETIIAEK